MILYMERLVKEKPWVNDLFKTHALQDITLRNLYEFFLKDNNIQKIIPIITSTSKISIRLIDWFVTNYSKKYNTTYYSPTIDDRNFNVHFQYKCKLKTYKKKQFDPFCRGEKNKRDIIMFRYDKNNYIKTTIGQLNFFKWAIECGIIDYVEKNIKTITDDMIATNKSRSETLTLTTDTSKKQRRRRHELSTSASKFINFEQYDVVISLA